MPVVGHFDMRVLHNYRIYIGRSSFKIKLIPKSWGRTYQTKIVNWKSKLR